MNCAVTVDDISRADAIYGPSLPILKGKIVRRRPEHLRAFARVALSLMIQDHHSSDVLDVDFFYGNGCTFLYTKSRAIKFKSVQRCYSRGGGND